MVLGVPYSSTPIGKNAGKSGLKLPCSLYNMHYCALASTILLEPIIV
jgi:hypothetical protein